MPFPPAIAERIRAQGGRATPARIKVLALLETTHKALSHGEVEQALAGEGLDRVTLYRVLDWLAEAGLARRTTDALRVFRFSLAVAGQDHSRHAHFRCEACGSEFCLEDVPVPQAVLPGGFSAKAVEFNISGQCARCEHPE